MLLSGVISSSVLANTHEDGPTEVIMTAGEGSNFYNGYAFGEMGSFNYFQYGATIESLYTTNASGVLVNFTLIFGLPSFFWGRSLDVAGFTLVSEGSNYFDSDFMFVPDEEYVVTVNDGATKRGLRFTAVSEVVDGKTIIGFRSYPTVIGTYEGDAYRSGSGFVDGFYSETEPYGTTRLVIPVYYYNQDPEKLSLVLLGHGSYRFSDYLDPNRSQLVIPNAQPLEVSEQYTVYMIDTGMIPDPNDPLVASFYPGDDGTGKFGFSDSEYGTARALDLFGGTALKRMTINGTTLTVVLTGDQTEAFENHIMRVSDMAYNVFYQSPFDAHSVYDPGEDQTTFTFSNAVLNFNALWLYTVDIVPIPQEDYANLAVIEAGSMGGITGYRSYGIDEGEIGSIISPIFGDYEFYALYSNGGGVITIMMEGTPSLADQRFRIEGGSLNLALDPTEATVVVDGFRGLTQWRWAGMPNLTASFYDVTIEKLPGYNLESTGEFVLAGDCEIETWSDDLQFTMIYPPTDGVPTSATWQQTVTEFTAMEPFTQGNWKMDGQGGLVIPPGVKAVEIHASIELTAWQVQASYQVFVQRKTLVDGWDDWIVYEPETWRVSGSAGFNDNVYSLIIPYLEVDEGDVITVLWQKSVSNAQAIRSTLLSFLHVTKVA